MRTCVHECGKKGGVLFFLSKVLCFVSFFLPCAYPCACVLFLARVRAHVYILYFSSKEEKEKNKKKKKMEKNTRAILLNFRGEIRKMSREEFKEFLETRKEWEN